MPDRIFSEGLVLPDGRKVRVLAYDDGSIRFRVSGTPYVLEEAFLQGGTQDNAIIKVAPRNPLTTSEIEDAPNDPFTRVRMLISDLKNQLDSVEGPASGPGSRKEKYQREGMNALLTVLTMMIEQWAPDHDDE